MTKPLQTKTLRILIYILLALFLTTFGLAWAFYNGQYKFFTYFISELGSSETLLGADNTTSKYIFGIGIMVTGLIALWMALEYFTHSQKSALNIIKGFTLLTMTAGAFMVMQPYDLEQNSTIHALGATMYVIGLDLYTFFCQFLRFKNRKLTFDTDEAQKVPFNKYFVFLILGGSVFFLIIALLGLHTWQPPTQKIIVVLSMLGILMLDPEDF